MEKARYIVGIDLGTTNTVVAWTDAEKDETSRINVFKIPQLTEAGVLETRESLPSFLYLKESHEVESPAFALPWCQDETAAVGEFARDRGAEVPGKLVSSAKSWLCNAAVDREGAILPWEASGLGEKMSPVEASSRILSHIRDAWNHEMASDDPNLALENQHLYLTVPASFDAVARELTVKAAKQAGFNDIILIEEPQAAFYSWLDQSGDLWRESVQKGDLVLVCDIGGGTSDFSLIEVQEDDGGALALERVAVGDHLLVGGDNIDLALSYYLAHQLKEKKKKLDAWQMRGLVHSCRNAKENLFSDQGVESHAVTILGRGSGLIKGTIKASLDLKDVEQVVLDGFFPRCALTDQPAAAKAMGMKEFGLSYEADPGITRHLARFVSSYKDESGNIKLPTVVIFNGGVMKSNLMRQRVLEVLAQWKEDVDQGTIREVEGIDFDLSVARGAAYYGQASQGDGVRIRAGLGQSYYMAIEASMPAVPGIPMPTRALCIAPFGMEEGTQAESRDRLFNLVLGETVTFDIMASSTRKEDRVGMVIDNWEEMDIREMSTIETHLEGGEDMMIPVTFEVKVTEIGTLEFWACSRDDDKKWRLELNVRPKD